MTDPSDVWLVVDAETLVINVTQAQSAEDLEAELAEAEAEVGIVHEATDADEAAAEPAEGEAESTGDAAEGTEGES